MLKFLWDNKFNIFLITGLIILLVMSFYLITNMLSAIFVLKGEGWVGVIIGSFIGWSVNYFSSKKQTKIIHRASEKIILENMRSDRSKIELYNQEARFKRYRSQMLSYISRDGSLRKYLKFIRIQLNENDIDYGQQKDNNEDFHVNDEVAAAKILSEFDGYQKKNTNGKYCFSTWFFDLMNKDCCKQYNDFFFREKNIKSHPVKHIWCSCTTPKSKDFTLYDFDKKMDKLYRDLDFSFGICIDDYLEKEKYDNNFCDLLEDIRKSF